MRQYGSNDDVPRKRTSRCPTRKAAMRRFQSFGPHWQLATPGCDKLHHGNTFALATGTTHSVCHRSLRTGAFAQYPPVAVWPTQAPTRAWFSASGRLGNSSSDRSAGQPHAAATASSRARPRFSASSAESVGSVWLGKSANSMTNHDLCAMEAVGFLHGQFALAVQPLDDAAGKLRPRSLNQRFTETAPTDGTNVDRPAAPIAVKPRSREAGRRRRRA